MSINNFFKTLATTFFSLNKGAWIIVGVTFVTQLSMMAFPFFLIYLTEALSFSAEYASLVLMSYGLGSVGACLVAGYTIARWGENQIIVASLLLNVVAFLGFMVTRDFVFIGCCAFVWGGAFNIYRVASQSLILLTTPTLNKKLTLSVYRLFLNLGMGIAPALGSVLIHVSFSALFLGCLIICLLALIVYSLNFKKFMSYISPQESKEQKPSRLFSSLRFQFLLFL